MNAQESLLRGRMSAGVAALPEIALALTCLAGLLVPKLAAALSPRMLLTLGLELVAIHAFVPLGGLALWKPKRALAKVFRIALALGFALFYSSVASGWGREAVASFWVLVVSTYFGLFVHDPPAERKRLLVARWSTNAVSYLAILFAVLVGCDALGIHSPRRELLVGTVLFGAFALFDLTGAYDRVATWLPRKDAETEATTA